MKYLQLMSLVYSLKYNTELENWWREGRGKEWRVQSVRKRKSECCRESTGLCCVWEVTLVAA